MNSTSPWRLIVERSAEKSLARLPRREAERVLSALNQMSQNPFAGDVRRLTNQPSAYRRRVGNWRIFFDVNYRQRLIAVVAIERRTTTAYRKR